MNNTGETTTTTTAVFAVHSFNSTHHYEFLLHITNVTQSDLHRYDLQVSSDLGTTVGSVRLYIGQLSSEQRLVVIRLLPASLYTNTSTSASTSTSRRLYMAEC